MDNNIKQLIHDIRNPVNTISMNAELGKLVLERGQADPEKLREIFCTILSECQRSGGLINELKSALSQAE